MDKMFKLYVLDDCESTTFLIKKWLTPDFDVETFNTPEAFCKKYNKDKPDLCILDVNLNDNLSGLDVLQELQKSKSQNVPFIFISQEDPEFRRNNAYQLGAVDYIKKPFEKDEFKLKIRNILKLIHFKEPEKNEFIELDEANLTLTLKDDDKTKSVRLTPKEFIIFEQLMGNKNSIVSREQILSHLEDSMNEKFGADRVVDVHVCNIKKKLGEFKYLINSVYGVGYKFVPERKDM